MKTLTLIVLLSNDGYIVDGETPAFEAHECSAVLEAYEVPAGLVPACISVELVQKALKQ